MTVGEIIKEFIESKKDELKDVKDYEVMFGISYYTLHKYLSNKRLPGYALLYNLKKHGLDISKLFLEKVFDETIIEWEEENDSDKYSKVAEPKVKYKTKAS